MSNKNKGREESFIIIIIKFKCISEVLQGIACKPHKMRALFIPS